MKVLVTGGAGFIGVNCALQLSEQGHEVIAFDNLSRVGSTKNAEIVNSLRESKFIEGDIRDNGSVEAIIKDNLPDVIIHLAGQVAVTKSVENPRHDLQSNVIGTFNLLEATRKYAQDAAFINACTNKVYGSLSDFSLTEKERRYDYESIDSVSETKDLSFHSPYGCSKGSAEQYVLDYSRMYDLNTVSFRQSCIYGPNQYGLADQGWMAWFVVAHELGKPITIFGDGKQVRDALHVHDLVDAYMSAVENISYSKGHAFNIGGGRGNSTSLLEFMSKIESISGNKPSYTFGEWRPGDQRVYISDLTKASEILGWSPSISLPDGISDMYSWIENNINNIKEIYDE